MALDHVQSGTPGSLKVRLNGGLEYRLDEFVFSFQAEVIAGLAARQTLGHRDEANMVRRARGEGATVLVVRSARPGTKCSHSQSAAAVGARFWASQGHQQSRSVRE
jgi:hypothetical protein